jgi:DNA polymerase I-like protein with 3'-5' exonuclease and polymerase domains
VKGIAFTLNISEAEANRLIAMYFKEFPLIEVYVNDAHAMARYNHYVMNTFGQAKREYGAMEIFRKTAVYNAAFRNAQNVRVQSTASTTGLYAFSHLNEAIKPMGGRSICTVYDSVELETPYKRSAEIIQATFYMMEDKLVEDFDWLDLPIAIDCEIGPNWGKQVKVHRGITQAELEKLMMDEFKIDMAA